MVDLHSHLLPCIDDGPKTVEESIELVKRELADGVDTIAVTPHFILDRWKSVDDFNEKRQSSVQLLKEALDKHKINIRIIEAAEVALSIDLPSIKGLEKLKYAGTDYMLVELPCGFYSDWIPNTLYNLRLAGITPVLAHVERFDYIAKKPEILYEFIDSGCLAQVNASFLVKMGHAGSKQISKLYHQNLLHVIATDTHSTTHRPPQLKDAMAFVEKKYGRDAREYFCDNAKAIVENKQPDLRDPVDKTDGFRLFGRRK